ncbi:hypothetical protein HTS61_25110 [Escherichia coli]|nr:hypothetical protein [Escherichia coli]
MLGDRNSNCLNLYYDELGRITQISGEQQRPCIRLHYELAAHPRRVTQIYQHFPETAPLLLRRYRYDEAGDPERRVRQHGTPAARVCLRRKPLHDPAPPAGRRRVLLPVELV